MRYKGKLEKVKAYQRMASRYRLKTEIIIKEDSDFAELELSGNEAVLKKFLDTRIPKRHGLEIVEQEEKVEQKAVKAEIKNKSIMPEYENKAAKPKRKTKKK